MPKNQKESLTAWTNAQITARQRANAGKRLSPVQQALLTTKLSDPTKRDPNISTVAYDSGDQEGIGSRIYDIITRPLGAVAGATQATIANIQNIAGADVEAQNPFESGWKAFTGEDRKSGADVLDQLLPDDFGLSKIDPSIRMGIAAGLMSAPDPITNLVGNQVGNSETLRNVTKSVGGLAFDVLADPSNLIAGGVIKAGLKAKSYVKKPAAALIQENRLVQEAANVEKARETIDDAAVTANGLAPETVKPLEVENLPRVEIPRLDSIGMGKIGKEIMDVELPKLLDPVTGKDRFSPGRERAVALREAVIPQWKARIEAEAAKGAKPEIFASDGTSYPLSTPHVLDALPPNVAEDLIFGATYPKRLRNDNLYFTQIDRGVAEALRVDDAGVPLVADKVKMVAQAILKAKPAAGKRRPSKYAAYEAAVHFVENIQTIKEVQFELTKTLVRKDLQDAAAITQTQSARILDNLNDPGVTLSTSMADLAAVGPQIVRSAKEVGASANAASIAGRETADIVAKVAPEADTAAARAALATSRERLAGAPDAKVNQRVQAGLRPVIKEADDLHGVPIVDLGVRADVQTNGIVQQLLRPIRNKASFGYGHQAFADSYRSGVEAAVTNGALYSRALNTISKKHSKEAQQFAFSAYKRGEKPVEPAALAAYDDLAPVVAHIFDHSNGYVGSFWRTGANVDQVNAVLREKGLGEFQYKAGKKAENVGNQWKNFDVKDPLDFLSRANGAFEVLAARQAFGTGFSTKFGKSKPAPGFVRIKTNEDDVLGTFIDTSKYYDREVVEQLTRLEAALKAPTSYRGEKTSLANFMNHVVDPFLSIWKPFMTIVRPGHHVRNMIGDFFAGIMDGVYGLGSYIKGGKMMNAGGALKAEGMEGLEKIAGRLEVNGANKMSTVRLRGRNEDISYDKGYQLANKHGLLISYHSSEDLIEATNKVTRKVMDSGPLRLAGLASEKSGQVMRLSHFSNLMERTSFTRQFATLDDAAAAAATRVKKFHPDINGLTPFEKRTMRRIIPFYSWMRQTAPIVVTTLLSKPGRVTFVNKALYNTQIAMGQDPDSLADPFPENQLYPSFIRHSLSGPIFGDTGVNLGSPTEGILGDMLNGNPARNVIGMVNPLFKTPVELATSTNLATGNEIHETGEYIDQQLPVLNNVAGISGSSPTGTVQNLLQGNFEIDPQRVVARGEKDRFFNFNLLNFLTGLGFHDTMKPSYQKIARQERTE